MSIASRINEMTEHLRNDWDSIDKLGLDITEENSNDNLDKNIENIAPVLDRFYNQASDKTDLAKNGIVGRTGQESTTGKNLFNAQIQAGTYNQATYTVASDGLITQSESDNSGWTISQNRVFYLDEGTYTFSVDVVQGVTSNIQIRNLTDNTNAILTNRTSGTFTLNGRKALAIKTYGSGGTYPTSYYIQVEQGSTATSYEPYTGGKPSPSPDYPQEINNLSGNVEYKVRGKNLLDKYNNLFQGTFYANTGGNDNIDSSTMFRCCTKKIDISNLSGNITCSGGYFELFAFYDENNDLISYVQNPTTTIPNGTKNVRVRFYGGDTEMLVSTLQQLDLMVENNLTATDYEPYISESFPLSLGDIELCKIDTYEDKIARSKGKNLFDKSNIIENTYISNKGGTGSSQVSNLSDYIEVKPNTSYTLSYDYSALLNSTQRGIVYYDENRIYISGVEYLPENKTHTITTPNSTKYIRFSYDKSCYSIMLNEGNTALPYEPYGKVWYLNKQIGKVILNGSETSWSYYSTGQYFYKTWNYPRGSAKMFIQFISNRYKNYQQQIVTSDNNKMVLVQQPDRNSEINISNHDYTTTSDFKTWLSTHNTIVYYPLALPTTTKITEENYPTLYSQLLAIQEFLTKYKINKEFLLDYSSPEIEY